MSTKGIQQATGSTYERATVVESWAAAVVHLRAKAFTTWHAQDRCGLVAARRWPRLCRQRSCEAVLYSTNEMNGKATYG